MSSHPRWYSASAVILCPEFLVQAEVLREAHPSPVSQFRFLRCQGAERTSFSCGEILANQFTPFPEVVSISTAYTGHIFCVRLQFT